MNKGAVGVMSFIAGAGIGALGMWFGVKQFYEARYLAESEEMHQIYAKKLDELEPRKNSIDGGLEGPEEIEPEPGMTRTRSSIVQELNNKPDLKDYSRYFHGKGQKLDNVSETLRDAAETAKAEAIDPSEALIEQDLAESQWPTEEDYGSDEDDDKMIDINEIHARARQEKWPPQEITQSTFYELSEAGYEKVELSWYMFDNTLVDEADGEINEADYIGDVIERSGFAENDNEKLWVRNDQRLLVFEIEKLSASFQK